MKLSARTLLALPATLLLAACVTLGGGGTPEEQVAALSQSRWSALIKQDFAAAYAYNSPAYRETVTLDDYKKRFGNAGAWKKAEVLKTECEPERCTVTARLTVVNMIPGFTKIPEITTELSEVWVRDQGQWWFYNPAFSPKQDKPL